MEGSVLTAGTVLAAVRRSLCGLFLSPIRIVICCTLSAVNFPLAAFLVLPHWHSRGCLRPVETMGREPGTIVRSDLVAKGQRSIELLCADSLVLINKMKVGPRQVSHPPDCYYSRTCATTASLFESSGLVPALTWHPSFVPGTCSDLGNVR